MTWHEPRKVKIVQSLVYGWLQTTFYVGDCWRKTVKTLVQEHHFRTLGAASLHHFTTVNDSENPCRERTTFYNSERQWKPLPRAYDILQQWRTVKTLAARLRHFTPLIASFVPLLRPYDVLCSCEAKQRSVSTGFSGPPLVLRFISGLYPLSLSHWKLRGFLDLFPFLQINPLYPYSG
jgi:hypothetical protein